MSSFDHANVLTVIGVCLDGGPVPYVVMPFMFNGDLLSYLKREKGRLVLPPDSEPDHEKMVGTEAAPQTICLSVCLSVCPSVCVSVCICFSVYLFVCLSICPSLSVFIGPSVFICGQTLAFITSINFMTAGGYRDEAYGHLPSNC